MSDWPHEAQEWADTHMLPDPRENSRRRHRTTRRWMVTAEVCWWVFRIACVVALTLGAISAFAAVGDDGYSFDGGCGAQGASCSYSSTYSIRFGHDDLWTFLGDKGPGAVECPTSSDAASQCYYYGGGVAPAGAARAPQGSAGPEGATPSTDPQPGVPGDGYQVGLSCVRDPVAAAALACSQLTGVSGAGPVSCSAPTIVGGVLSYTLLSTTAVGPVTHAVKQAIQGCEPQDLTTWGPAIAAWFLALVTILCARSVYTKVFNRETV